MIDINAISQEEFLNGIREYRACDGRAAMYNAMYRVATFLVEHFWGRPRDMADGLGVLLLTWNQAFYRGRTFDFDRLERCIANSLSQIGGFRYDSNQQDFRKIFSLSSRDENDIICLFKKFLDASQIVSDGNGVRSPVSVAKALHILAPAFFPLWDNKIAQAYGCYCSGSPDERANKYISFIDKMKKFATKVRDENYTDHIAQRDSSLLNLIIDGCEWNKPLLKLIDEYNYARFTRGWI